MKNAELQEVYEKAHRDGGFWSQGTRDITGLVAARTNWRSKAVLEIGCGDGFTARTIAELGAYVVATDYSEEAISKAKKLNAHPRVRYLCRNNVDNFSPGFGVIVAQEILEHTDDPLSYLKVWKSLLCEDGGEMIVTCPSFLNPRGMIWMTLQTLLEVPMSLTDLHFIAPWQMEEWGESLGFSVEWSTFRYDLGSGEQMRVDMSKRLHNALRDAGLSHDKDRIAELLAWVEKAGTFQTSNGNSGAGAIYHLQRK